MARKTILITAGATKEPIDPVRFISNASSGKMGYALAGAAMEAGFEVVLIGGDSELPVPKGVEFVKAISAGQMFEAVKKYFSKCDCLIMAAAVSDYTPAKVSSVKIKKTAGPVSIELQPTEDILKWAGGQKGQGQYLVGFALEDVDLKSRAEKKMSDKNLDMIVANSPDAIGADSSSVYIKQKQSDWVEILDSDKPVTAKKIINLIADEF